MSDHSAFIHDTLETMFPQAKCELNHKTPTELMVAIMLSAQTTDVAVNNTTEHLFQKFNTLEDFANADLTQLENEIRHLGLFRNKAKNIQLMAQAVLSKHQGIFPKNRVELLLLPGVGRKTANVFLAEHYHVPAIAVDTHVHRVSQRLGLSEMGSSVDQVELDLMKKFPESQWISMHHFLIFFGRYFCTAKKPNCQKCPFVAICETPFP